MNAEFATTSHASTTDALALALPATPCVGLVASPANLCPNLSDTLCLSLSLNLRLRSYRRRTELAYQEIPTA